MKERKFLGAEKLNMKSRHSAVEKEVVLVSAHNEYLSVLTRHVCLGFRVHFGVKLAQEVV